jgi:hypothetical protein
LNNLRQSNITFGQEVGEIGGKATSHVDVSYLFLLSGLSWVVVQDSKGETGQQQDRDTLLSNH